MITIIDNFDGFGDEPKETLEELNKISEEQLRQFETETKAGFNPNQPRGEDGKWGSGGDKITVYRGRGRNYAEGENEGFLWVATNKETASNYAEWDEDGNPLVDEWQIDKPKNPLKFPYKRPNQYVTSENIENIFRQYLLRKIKAKEISIEDYRLLSEKINKFRKLAGDKVEALSTVVNKKETAKISSEIIRDLGFDALEISEGTFVTYGLLKTKKLLKDIINQKAGFKPGQARDKDGKWADKWAGMKTREQEIKDQKKETALIYDADGNLLQEIGGSETHVEIPFLQDGAHTLTHNHPNSSSFSRADILFLTDNDLGIIRAVGPSGNVFEMTLKKEFFGWKSEVLTSWSDAKELADAEVKSYLVESLGKDWETPYWRENENKVKTAQKVFGRWSDRVNWHLANSTEFGKDYLTYKKIKP